MGGMTIEEIHEAAEKAAAHPLEHAARSQGAVWSVIEIAFAKEILRLRQIIEDGKDDEETHG